MGLWAKTAFSKMEMEEDLVVVFIWTYKLHLCLWTYMCLGTPNHTKHEISKDQCFKEMHVIASYHESQMIHGWSWIES
jgi:hypothetical protein